MTDRPLAAPQLATKVTGGEMPTPFLGASQPTYLRADQVAELLQVSEKSVYRWMKADPTMPALKIGGTVRFPRERLERWLREREQGTPRLRRVQTAATAGKAAS
ncbi:MAG: helix-turn-helix domain-containing protein [Candidatus Rokubacteria bacterium]|nr:helix-turn-helix domain-containing protein [Candidatus Rokubacteria bacterium]